MLHAALPHASSWSHCPALRARFAPQEETLKKRMIRAVASLGKKEVADIIAQEGKLEVRRGAVHSSDQKRGGRWQGKNEAGHRGGNSQGADGDARGWVWGVGCGCRRMDGGVLL